MLFAAVVQALAAERTLPLRVDPRPLDPRAQGTRRTSEDLAIISAANLQRRAAALDALGIPQVNALAGEPCSGRGGMPPPSPPRRPPGKEALQPLGRFSCAILSLPRSASEGVDLPHRQMQPGYQGEWIVRAIIVEPGVWAEFRITAARAPGDDWTILEITRLIEVVA
jgi:hypothetical protein